MRAQLLILFFHLFKNFKIFVPTVLPDRHKRMAYIVKLQHKSRRNSVVILRNVPSFEFSFPDQFFCNIMIIKITHILIIAEQFKCYTDLR